MKQAIIARTSGPCYQLDCTFRYEYVLCHQQRASRGESNLCGDCKRLSRASGQLPRSEENVCFPKQGYEVNPHQEKSKSCATLCRISPTSLNSDNSEGKSALSHVTCA